MKRVTIAVLLLASLGGCSLFGRGGSKGPKTPLLGERIAILSHEGGAEVDPGLADVPVLVPTAVANSDWAQSGGNAQKAMGHLALGNALERVWTTSIAGGNKKKHLAAGPVVAAGTLYVMGTDALIEAFDARTGAAKWRRSLGVRGDDSDLVYGGGVSYEDGRVYATNGVGDVAALDASTGSVLWKVRPSGPLRGSPTIHSGQVYVVTQDNQIFALSAQDGKTIWNEAGALESSGIFGAAAPAAAQGTVVAGFSSGELTAFRYENGRAVWQDALSRTTVSTTVASLSDIDADPVIDEGRVYAVGEGGRMVALELVTGQRLWELNIGGIATPSVAGDWVFVVTDQARLICISKLSGKVRWMTALQQWKKAKKKDQSINWVGPVVAGDRLILANSRGELVNVGLADGKVGRSVKNGGPVSQQPVVANNMLYILDDSGRLSAWR